MAKLKKQEAAYGTAATSRSATSQVARHPCYVSFVFVAIVCFVGHYRTAKMIADDWIWLSMLSNTVEFVVKEDARWLNPQAGQQSMTYSRHLEYLSLAPWELESAGPNRTCSPPDGIPSYCCLGSSPWGRWERYSSEKCLNSGSDKVRCSVFVACPPGEFAHVLPALSRTFESCYHI